MTQGRITILTVDDESRILKLERSILETQGYTVVAAQDGPQAIQIVAETPPSLVLLDVAMPGMDGFSVCRSIREFSQVPIIVVTGKGGDEDRVRGLEIGADDYVIKPFFSRELLARVKAVLRRAVPQDGAPFSSVPPF